MFIQSVILAITFSTMMYGIGLAVAYKMIKNDPVGVTFSITTATSCGIAFFVILLTTIKGIVS